MINIKRPGFFLPTPSKTRFQRRPIHCRGQTLVEYSLILAFISVVAISVLIQLGQSARSLYTTIDSQVARAPGGVNYSGG